MEEIKFRARFRKISNSKECWQEIIIAKNHITPLDNIKLGYTQVTEWEQYIGKKDKNGENIYKGDILSSFVDPEIILKHVVEWSDKYCCWYLWNIKDTARVGDGSVQAFVYFNNTGKNCERIGSIHETQKY